MIQNLQARLAKKEEGFTLVELLVVIVILGILAAIVVFAVGGITDKGDASATATDRSVLETAQEAHFANASAGVYASETELVNKRYLRAVSTKHDICLSTTAHTAGLNKAYEVIPATGGSCGTNFAAAP